jgi:hypothetical protein
MNPIAAASLMCALLLSLSTLAQPPQGGAAPPTPPAGTPLRARTAGHPTARSVSTAGPTALFEEGCGKILCEFPREMRSRDEPWTQPAG